VRIWLAAIAAVGCSASVDEAPSVIGLRFDPPEIALAIDLQAQAPAQPIHVLALGADGNEGDVTVDAHLELAGTPIGAIEDGMLVSDGMTGGAATITATYGGRTASATATATVYGRRTITGTAVAGAAFAAASATAIDASVSPADGAVLPPNLGAFAVDFTAADTDDAHELHVTAPYLDIAVDAPGVPGPRELALDANEWQAIASTARGASISVDVASMNSHAPQDSRVAHASYDVADLDVGALLVGMMPTGGVPAFVRYDASTAKTTPLLTGVNGACVGCHIAISPDGSRIAAGVASTNGGPAGILFDGSGTILATSDTSASPWVEAAFDPSGAMIGVMQGVLTLRDRTTANVVQTLATGELATSAAVAPDGSTLAYTELDATDAMLGNPVGNALHVRSWNAATAALGPVREIVRDGGGILMPVYSPDGQWIVYGHSTSTQSEEPTGGAAVKADGSAIIQLTTDPKDQLARWASPITAAQAGGRPAERMVWIAFNSARPIGNLPAGTNQLWLEAVFLDRGVVSPAFHLPGQGTATVLHGPIALP